MRSFIGPPTLLLFASALSAQVQVLTANYGADRTNANIQEQILNTSNVTPETFGKLASFAVDGQIYAQPLYVGGAIVDGTARNVIYAATMHNTVYAFDADALGPRPLWSATLGPSVPSSFVNSPYLGPEIGILSTPVIDLARNAIDVVTYTLEKGAPVFRLHALDLSDGSEKLGGPVEIRAVVTGSGAASQDGNIGFDPVQHIQRPGLLLANDNIYAAFGSHSDDYPYHGWIMAYDASNIARQTAVFNTTANGDSGAIWQSGRGLAADEAGNIYLSSGNGDYDGTRNFGQSLVKLSPDLQILDWFTPQDWSWLSDYDYDVGSLGPVLIGNQLIGGDKFGNLYLIDRDDMGRLGASGMSFPQIFQPVGGGGIFSIALWNSDYGPIAYVSEAGSATMAYRMINGQFETSFFSSGGFADDFAYQGVAVSGDGGTPGTGILWMTVGDHSSRGVAPGTLHAVDALDLGNELWNSGMAPDRDTLGAFAKFVAPTVANGRVYVPTFSNQLVVYGLLD